MGKSQASITVFFTLIFLLILALVGTMIDLSRYQISSNHTWRTLRRGTASLFTEYSRPFYDEYNLFLLEDTGISFEQVIASYMNDTMTPKEGQSFSLLEGFVENVHVTQRKYVGDKEGRALTDEITRFMKRKLPADAFEKFIQRNKNMTDIVQETHDLKEEVEEEEEAAELDLNTLELMRLVDGVRVEDGSVFAETVFVKMLAVGKKTPSDMGLNNELVWKEVSPNIQTVDEFLSNEKSCCSLTNQLIEIHNEAEEIVKNMKSSLGTINKKAENLKDYYTRIDTLIFGNAQTVGLEAVLKGNLEILNQINGILKSGWTDENKAKIRALLNHYEYRQIQFDYTGISNRGGDENPQDTIGGLLDEGLLDLVVKEPKKISNKKIDTPDGFLKLYQEKKADEVGVDSRLESFFEEDKADFTNIFSDLTRYAETEFMTDTYIDSYFGHMNQSVGSMKKALTYEQEYIIGGGKSDKDNLANVAKRILLLRSLSNIGTLLSDAKSRQEAYTAALGIVGFTGMEPLIRLTQTLILITWALAEGLVDVAAVLQGKKVPLIKRISQMTVAITDLLVLNRSLIQKKAKTIRSTKGAIGYDEYLILFLVSMKNSVKRYRMMDLMEGNIKKNYVSTFQLGSCVTGIEVSAVASYPSLFFHMPIIERMTKRSLKNFSHKALVTYQY